LASILTSNTRGAGYPGKKKKKDLEIAVEIVRLMANP